MPIEGLSNRVRIPRLGKIHLGTKAKNKNGVEYPVASKFFVFKDQALTDTYGNECSELPIMFPSDDVEVVASQYYRAYSQSRGLLCKGDGKMCHRVTDMDTGDMVTKDTMPNRITMVPLNCTGQECELYKAKKCSEIMMLQFLLPEIPGVGVWQIDTGSINSILNINSMLAVIKRMVGHIAFIPLELTIEQQEVVAEGKKKNVFVLNLRIKEQMGDFLAKATQTLPKMLGVGVGLSLPVADDEAPSDTDIIEGEVVDNEKAQKDAEELFAPEPTRKPATHTNIPKQPVKPTVVDSVTPDGDCDDFVQWAKEQNLGRRWPNILKDIETTYGISAAKISDAIRLMTDGQRAKFHDYILSLPE